jgi:hypothetical protein
MHDAKGSELSEKQSTSETQSQQCWLQHISFLGKTQHFKEINFLTHS